MTGQTAARLSDDGEAGALDSEMERAFDLLDGSGADPYDIALPVARRLLGAA